DGEPASAWMAYGLQDVLTLRQFVQDSNADPAHKRVEHHKLESMLGLCELITCRRHALLAYFDEDSSQRCGNCDNCTNPPEKWDGTVATQKALSCIYRTGQRFGVNYLIDVLHGKTDERIQNNNHDQISTYGIGNDFTTTEWRSIYRQLIALGYIDVDTEGYGALHLTEKCRPLLRGDETIDLRKQTKQEKPDKDKKAATLIRPQDQTLWDSLRSLRSELAEQFGVPPYVIFHDATLHEMIKNRPLNTTDMAHISGVGKQKLDRYGQQFISEIASHPLPPLLDNRLSDTVNETLMLYQQKISIDQIALKREIKVTTVYTHLADAIATGLLPVFDVISLERDEYETIVSLMESFANDEQSRLKPVYDALDQEVDYGVLKCIQASI
ncbi:MAG: ATP-dependent DNA helicase RecQ, partial [Gammaproteobacteria bacterium]